MKNAFFTLVTLACVAFLNSGHAQDTVKIDFSDMTPHVGQYLYLRIVDLSNNSEIGRTKMYLTSPDFSISMGGIMPGGSYDVDFFADLNKNGKYDTPPADHAWRIELDNVMGDTTVSFTHNTNFTNIAWPHQIAIDFSDMTPHVGQDLYLSLFDLTTGSEMQRQKIHITDPVFNVDFDSITPGDSYKVDFFADFNSNGLYDPPPTDHAWRITLNDVMGDTTVDFVHNTNFTDIQWKYLLTINFTDFTPHIGNLFELFLRDYSTMEFLDTIIVDPITVPDFTVKSYKIMPGGSYNIDFFADLNNNRMYDPPPVDHAWRIPLMDVMGDTTISFTHNTSFTDIGLTPSGIKNTIMANISFYPNPVKNLLTINFIDKISGLIKVNIYNSEGILVKEMSTRAANSMLNINLSELKSGMYILDLAGESSTGRFKFVKE